MPPSRHHFAPLAWPGPTSDCAPSHIELATSALRTLHASVAGFGNADGQGSPPPMGLRRHCAPSRARFGRIPALRRGACESKAECSCPFLRVGSLLRFRLHLRRELPQSPTIVLHSITRQAVITDRSRIARFFLTQAHAGIPASRQSDRDRDRDKHVTPVAELLPNRKRLMFASSAPPRSHNRVYGRAFVIRFRVTSLCFAASPGVDLPVHSRWYDGHRQHGGLEGSRATDDKRSPRLEGRPRSSRSLSQQLAANRRRTRDGA